MTTTNPIEEARARRRRLGETVERMFPETRGGEQPVTESMLAAANTALDSGTPAGQVETDGSTRPARPRRGD